MVDSVVFDRVSFKPHETSARAEELFDSQVARPVATPPTAETVTTLPVKTLVQDEYLFREGEPKRVLYRVETGALCLTQRGAHGTPEFIELATPGDVVGLGFLDHHIQSAAALVETSVSIWPLSSLAELCEASPAVREKQADATEREFAYRRHELSSVNAESPLRRVAAFLLVVSRLNEAEGRDPEVISETLRSGDVAHYLGLDVDTLGRALVELQRRELVSQRANGGLRLDKRAELDRLSSGTE